MREKGFLLITECQVLVNCGVSTGVAHPFEFRTVCKLTIQKQEEKTFIKYLWQCSRQNNDLQWCPRSNPWNLRIYKLLSKRELRFLISWIWDGKITLYYLGGLNVITRVLTSKRKPQKSQCQSGGTWERLEGLCWPGDGRGQDKECLRQGSLKKLQTATKQILPESPKRNTTLMTLWFSSNETILDLSPEP